MQLTMRWLQHVVKLSAFAGAVMPFFCAPAFSELYDFVDPTCIGIESYAQKVDLHNLSNLAPKDVKNITVALKIIPELAHLDTIYIDSDDASRYYTKADVSPRTIIFPYKSCPSGCIGYIVNDTAQGFSSIPFYYLYNISIEPSIDNKTPMSGRLVLLDLDQRNIVVLQRRNRNEKDASTVLIAPASQAGAYDQTQSYYLSCLTDRPSGR